MAIDFIKVDASITTQKYANDLIRFVNEVRTVLTAGDEIKERMGRMHDGADFTLIETLYGLPTGTGQTVFDLVNGTVGALRGVFGNNDAGEELSQRVG